MKDFIEQNIEFAKRRLSYYRKLAGRKIDIQLRSRYDNRTGKYQYYMKKPDESKDHYVKKKNLDKVLTIQMKAFAREMIKVLTHNIDAMERFLEDFIPDSEYDVIKSMPHAYQPIHLERKQLNILQSENPFKREELRLRTSFGLMVRSKGEVIIAEFLYSFNIEFYYEKALTIYSEEQEKYVTYYPDFTIILPSGKTIYWEHEGLLYNLEYAKSYMLKLMDYNINEIYESNNLIVTSDGRDNRINVEGIKRVIMTWILPEFYESWNPETSI